MGDYIRYYFPGLCGVSETTMWHSLQASATTFPHVSLFTKGEDSAKTVPVRCCFSRTCFGPFRSITASSFDSITPGNKHFVGRGFWPNCVSHSCLRRVSLTVPKPLDSCSTFHKAVVSSRASSHTLFLGSKGWILPRHLHTVLNRGPQLKDCCSLKVFSWTLCIIPNEKGAEWSKILNLFIHAPLLTRDDDR